MIIEYAGHISLYDHIASRAVCGKDSCRNGGRRITDIDLAKPCPAICDKNKTAAGGGGIAVRGGGNRADHGGIREITQIENMNAAAPAGGKGATVSH